MFDKTDIRAAVEAGTGLVVIARTDAMSVLGLDEAIARVKEMGIEVVADRPGVGQNLQDHLEYYHQFKSKLPITLHSKIKGRAWSYDENGKRVSKIFETTPGRMILGELLPKNVAGGAMASRRRQRSCLTARSSKTASMTRSHGAKASVPPTHSILASAASRASAVIFSFSTARASCLAIPALPFSARSTSMSDSSTR